jgi:hypothetical protein
MQPNLPLREMTRAEKLKTIDQIWDDLMKNPDEIPSPDWHTEVLSARAQRIKTGEAVFKDFEENKAILRDEFK